MSETEHGSTHAPLSFWQALFRLPRSIWMPILAMSFIAVAAFLFNEWSIRQIESSAATLASLTSAQKDLAEFRTRMVDAETGQRGYLLSHNPRSLDQFEDSLTLLTIVGERLRLYAVDDPSLSPKAQRLEALRAQRIAQLRATLVLAQRSPTGDVALLTGGALGSKVADDFRLAADELRAVLDNQVAQRLTATGRSAQLTRIAFAVLTTLLLLLLFVSVRILVTDYWRQESARRVQSEERQRLEALVAERTAELSNLTAYLQTAAEQEKATLARDLHDEFGGLLTAAKMDLAWLRGRASASEPQTHAKLDELGSVLDEAMDVKRRVVENLRPALLDHFGLPVALQSYFEETCKKAGIKCTPRIQDDFAPLNQDLAIALFRVGQESLTNILKHAMAENVDLSLSLDDGIYRILISDDGVGIPPERLDGSRSHGLVGMRHRIESLGGKFTIRANSPHGTRIEVAVPRDPPRH
jgi:signal transduction histidine kinase